MQRNSLYSLVRAVYEAERAYWAARKPRAMLEALSNHDVAQRALWREAEKKVLDNAGGMG